MRLPGSRLASAFVMCAAVGSAALLIAIAPAARAAIGTAATPTSSPSPPPTPTPVNAFISLDVTAGDANTVITVNGSAFLPNESTSLYWDQPAHVSGASNADANGGQSDTIAFAASLVIGVTSAAFWRRVRRYAHIGNRG